MRDPYHTIGLRCNPFIAEQELGVDETLWMDRGFSLAPEIRAKQLVQLIGEKGAGKTSHLVHWQQQTGGSYCYYPPELHLRWKWPPVAAIAYWDEANRIPLPLLVIAFWQAAQTHATIAVGTHADLSKLARFCGLAVQTIQIPGVDVDTLMGWANRRIEAVRSPHTPPSPLILTYDRAAQIVAQSGASWRTAATLLHIWAADVAKHHSC